MLNRDLLIVKLKQPLVDWIDEADLALWTQDRTLELFRAWIGEDVQRIIFDVVGKPLIDDEIEDTSEPAGRPN